MKVRCFADVVGGGGCEGKGKRGERVTVLLKVVMGSDGEVVVTRC